MAAGSINLSRVDISLAEFQRMSDGKYNAGEVKLSSETGLKKVNNHVHRLGANKVEISHEEVLAIKEAFVKALNSGGVVDQKEKVCDIYKKGPLDDVGPDDFFAYGVPMQILAMDAVPGLMDKIQAFFDRADVKSLDFDAENGPATNAASLRYALVRAEELPVMG